MSRNFEPKFSNIDALLNEVEQSTDGKKLFASIDDMCGEIDSGIEKRKSDIENLPVEQKRKEAVDSEDAFELNLLSMDEDFNIRTLSACNPNMPNNSLRRLVESSNDYIRMVIANNPNVAHDILDRIAEVTNEQEVLDAVRSNPNVSKVTKYKIENRM
ncbi:MAG: hypothetical protein KKA99_06250 [Gammaproteobacteria bacterium]|nr:hypothetical protein [Gammaproteobacteria bacterium]